MAKDDLTAQRLRELLDYDPETGVFRWKVTHHRIQAGMVAGCKQQKRGYWQIRIRPFNYVAHRLAWLHFYGEWPKNDIDHMNGDRLDNRIANLRDVTRAVNLQNKRIPRAASGLMGAFRKRGKWYSGVTINRKQINLGVFETALDAHHAYLAAKRKLHEGCTI